MNTKLACELAVILAVASPLSYGVTISPNPVAFGKIEVDKSTSKTVTLTNNGSATEKLNGFNINNDAFKRTVSTCPTSLAPKASCSWQVSFSPTADEAETAIASVWTSAGTFKFSLSGTGFYNTPPAAKLPPGTMGTKWYPGHYQTVKSKEQTSGTAWEKANFKAALAHPKMMGYLLYINWNELEGDTKGSYDFSQIDELLDVVGRKGKKLQIKIQERSFMNELNGNMPRYVVTSGCAFKLARSDTPDPNDYKGLALKWYKPECVDHFIDLYKAIGRKYDSDTRLAAVTIGDGESALDGAPDQRDFTSPQIHVGQIIRAAEEVKELFPNTLVATGYNGGVEGYGLHEIAQGLYDIGGSAFMHPDTYPGRYYGKNGEATKHEIEFRGRVPTIPQLQQTSIPITMTELEQFRWATETIGVSMVSWGDARQGVADYISTRVLKFLDTNGAVFPVKNFECPSRLAPCIDD